MTILSRNLYDVCESWKSVNLLGDMIKFNQKWLVEYLHCLCFDTQEQSSRCWLWRIFFYPKEKPQKLHRDFPGCQKPSLGPSGGDLWGLRGPSPWWRLNAKNESLVRFACLFYEYYCLFMWEIFWVDLSYKNLYGCILIEVCLYDDNNWQEKSRVRTINIPTDCLGLS